MSWTQIISIACCGVLGYWLVAVFLPLLVKSREGYREDPSGPYAPADGPTQAGDSAPRPWHEVLGVREDSSVTDIAAAYRQKISQYHPDRVAQMGPDIRQLAEQRSSEINAAYERAIKPRGR